MKTNNAEQITIAQLLGEVRALENLARYYENRILRKRIAIEEILSGRECRRDGMDEPAPPAFLIPSPVVTAAATVRGMIEQVLPGLSAPFWYAEIKNAVLAKYPAEEAKIRRGIYPAVHELIAKRVLEKTTGGFQVVATKGQGNVPVALGVS